MRLRFHVQEERAKRRQRRPAHKIVLFILAPHFNTYKHKHTFSLFYFSISFSLSHTHILTLDGWTDISVSKVRMMPSEDCSFSSISASLWHCHAAAAGACEFQSLQGAEWRGYRCVGKWKETGRSNFSELLVINQIYRRTP